MNKLYVITAALSLMLLGSALAASNPSGTGQPNQSCQSFFGDAGPFSPNGFNTAGFNHATTVYAGTGGQSNPTAVSQYDVACFQQFSK